MSELWYDRRHMRLRHTLIIALLTVSSFAEAFELVMIQAVSENKKSFITRNGKRQGITAGMTGTFTAEDVSLIARAVSVTGNFTQWQVMNPEVVVPYEKGAIVTYYSAPEYLWALAPEAERKKYIKTQIPVPRTSLVFKGAITRAMSESVSGVQPTTTQRGGYLGEIYYEKDIYDKLAFDVGLRYEREAINYPGATYITSRSLLMADILYYFNPLKEFMNGKFYIGMGAGYGRSSTTTVGQAQSGPVALLPAVKAGVNLPFDENWEFLFDTAFEALQTRETQSGGTIQTTTQTNVKVGFGLRRVF